MFGPTRYLDWARRFYGQVRCDLASSGIPAVSIAELGQPPAAVLDDPAGWSRFRAAIARYNDVTEGEAVASLGTSHALWLAYSALTSPGDDVLVERPGYEPVERIAEGLGLHVRVFERREDEGYGIDPDRIARALSPTTRVVALTSLHNPTGVRAEARALSEVGALLARRGGHLLVDEVYAPFDDLTDGGVFRGTARRLGPNVVTVGSLTKCYGLGPARIGWVLGPEPVVARANDAVTASCGMLPLTHAHMAVHAFHRIDDLARRARAVLSGKRTRVSDWVARLGLRWSAPDAGLFGFVRVPGAVDLRPAIEAAATRGEVLVAPGSFFGAPEGFRVAWSRPDNVLAEGLQRLEPIVLRARAGGDPEVEPGTPNAGFSSDPRPEPAS